jgi:hypothetical protein
MAAGRIDYGEPDWLPERAKAGSIFGEVRQSYFSLPVRLARIR